VSSDFTSSDHVDTPSRNLFISLELTKNCLWTSRTGLEEPISKVGRLKGDRSLI
jgi:hypothetical protein